MIRSLNPSRPQRRTLRWLQAEARRCGLYVAKYNPGDGATFKVLTADVDYFAASGSQTLARLKSLKAVERFVARHCRKGEKP